MNILITGGTGFIGKTLSTQLLNNGHQVYVLSRQKAPVSGLDDKVKLIQILDPQAHIFDVIINLAGEPLNKKRWNAQVKNNLIESRVNITQKLLDYIAQVQKKPHTLISGSAIGYYGSNDHLYFKEETPSVSDCFTHQLCKTWEEEALQAKKFGVRVCLLRMGIVLGKEGGALKEMLPSFRWGVGTQLGNGKQWMSWIHKIDVVRAIEFLILHNQLDGPFNLTAPTPVTHAVFTLALAKKLHRPLFLRMPDWTVKMLFGEMGQTLLLQGQKVIPQRLIDSGFSFTYNTLDEAFASIL